MSRNAVTGYLREKLHFDGLILSDCLEMNAVKSYFGVERGAVEELMESRAIWNCLSCMACLERCPRSVEPARLVEAARLMVIRQAGKNHLLPDQLPALLDEEMPQQALVSALRKYGK